MSTLLTVAAALGLGLGAWRLLARLPGSPPPAAAVPLWGALGMGLWMGLLDLTGLPWSTPLLLAPGVAGLGIALGVRRVPSPTARETRTWALAAAAVAAAHVALLAFRPAFGWDFRYIWGLKARVFALAGGHDPAWLGWPGHAFAHPDYPPLWCDVLAAAARLGGEVAIAGGVWTALLAAGLAGACWYAASGAPVPLRALAAAAGAWAPVLFSPACSGYAEPMLAFSAAIALGALARAGEDGALVAAAGAVAVLGMTKNEGIALAVGVVLGGALTLERRRALWLAAGLLPALVWRAVLLVHDISGEGLVLAPAALAHRLAQLPAALAGAADPDFALLAACWALALLALCGAGQRAACVALAVWGAAVLLVYLAGTTDMLWRMATSLDRVLAAPLPATLALALGRAPDAASGTATGERASADPEAPASRS